MASYAKTVGKNAKRWLAKANYPLAHKIWYNTRHKQECEHKQTKDKANEEISHDVYCPADRAFGLE